MEDEATEFLRAMRARDRKPYWLVFCGVSGVGKTHLAKKIFKGFLAFIAPQNKLLIEGERIVGNNGRFIDWRKFSDDQKKGEFWDLDDICSNREWLVVIDDIGAEYDPNGFILSKLDMILNGRLGLFTVITTNMPFKDIAEKLDSRIASRMLRNESVIVECDEMDFNLR